MTTHRRQISLSIAVTGDEPPNEFRIFGAGKVETTKGNFLFDAAAAAAVMAEYAKHGIDLMIDYDHASLASVSLDPATAGKAAGWFNLEVRAGELWAVNVRWTPPAAEALRRKEWRFMSPAFETEEGRVVSLMNVAITNLPATRRLEPLMAASVTALGDNAMTVEEFLKVIKALGLDMSMPLEEALAKIKGEPAAGDAQNAPADAAPANVAAAAPVAPEEETPAEVAAALSRIMRLSGKPSFVEALGEIEAWHASHLKLETETQKLAAERATLEAAERRKGCVELVTLAGRAPATVWADDKASAPKKYLAAMPITDFREYVADAIKANGGKGVPKPPVALDGAGAPVADGSKEFTTPHGVVSLSAREIKNCEDAGAKLEVYAANKAIQAKARVGKKE